MTNQELIEKCASGDMQAFDVLVRTYQTKIINIAYGMLQNKEDAYDVAQEVFIKIYRNIGAFTGKASLDTWIHRITVNATLDAIRKSGRRIQTVPLVTEKEETEIDLPVADESASPEKLVLTAERRREILAAIGMLNEKYRAVLVLREFEDLDYEQIAQTLGISVGTVKSRLNRAREKLRNILEK